MSDVIRFGALATATCAIALAAAACGSQAGPSPEHPTGAPSSEQPTDVEGVQFSSGLVLDVFVPVGWRMKSALSGYEDEDGTGISNSVDGDNFYLMRLTGEVGALLDDLTEDPAEQPWHELDDLVEDEGGYSIWVSAALPCSQIDAQRVDLQETIREDFVDDPSWVAMPNGVGEEGMLLAGYAGISRSVYLSRLPVGNGDCHHFRAEGGTFDYGQLAAVSAQLTKIIENSTVS